MTDKEFSAARNRIRSLRDTEPEKVFALCGKWLAKLEGADADSLRQRICFLEHRIAARKRMKELRMERPQECRECHRAEPDVTFRLFKGKKVGRCNECIAKARAEKAASAKLEADPPQPPAPAEPVANVRRIGDESSRILALATETAGDRNLPASATPALIAIAVAAARIQEMTR